MKIAYFSHDSILEGVGASQVLAVCKELSNIGIDLHLFTFEKIDPPINVVDEVRDSGITWSWFPFKRSKYSAIRRILTLTGIKDDFDIIHARGDLAAFSAVLRNKERVIWDIRSLWFEQKKVLDPKRFNFIVGVALGLMTSFISRRVAGVNTLSESIVPYLETRYPKLSRNRTVVSTCVNLNLFKLNKSLPSQITALLSGTYNEIYDQHLIQDFLNYEVKVKKTKLIWAHGFEASSSLDIQECTKVFADYASVPKLIAQSSFGIAICRQDLGVSLDAAMPTKIAEFLAVGRPLVINGRLGDSQSLLIKNRVAVVLESELDIPRCSEELHALILDPELPNRCRKVAEDFFSLTQGSRRYQELYDRVMNEQK